MTHEPMKRCRYCREMIAASAAKCPRCGAWLSSVHKPLTLVLAGILLLLLFAVFVRVVLPACR